MIPEAVGLESETHMTAGQLSTELANLARHSKVGVNLQVLIEHGYLRFMVGGTGMYFPITDDGILAPDYGKEDDPAEHDAGGLA